MCFKNSILDDWENKINEENEPLRSDPQNRTMSVCPVMRNGLFLWRTNVQIPLFNHSIDLLGRPTNGSDRCFHTWRSSVYSSVPIFKIANQNNIKGK